MSVLPKIVLIVLIFGAKTFAQGTETLTRGVLKQVDSQPIMGASVTIQDTETGFTTGMVSGETGEFLIKELPVGGPYTITITYVGFKTLRLKGYKLSQGSRVNLGDLVLEESVASLDEVVLVENKTAAFTSKIDVGETLSISKRLLDQIPTQTRDFKALANYSSQSSIPINKERYGISIAGVKSTGIGYTIDGANARRGVFGGTSGDAAFIISMEAIEEFKVETNNYSVIGPRNGGGSIKAITRKGTNKTEGAVWSYYTGDGVSQGKDFNGGQVGGKAGNAFTNWQAGFRVSGPIVKNKLTYVALYDRYTKNAPDGSSLLNYDLYTAGEQQGIAKADAQRLFSLLQQAGVVKDGSMEAQTGTFQKNDVTQNFFFRTDWNISQVHKLTGRFSYLDYVGTYNATNVYSLYMNKDRRQGWAERSFRGLINLKSYFPSGSYNDLKLNVTTDNRFLTVPGERRPSVNVGVGSNGIEFGSPWWGGEEIYQTQFQLIDDFSFNTKNGWNITLGTDNLMHYAKEFYPHFTGGVMSYNSIDDLQNNVINNWTRLIPTDGKDAKRYYQYPLIENALYAQFSKYIVPELKVEFGLRWDSYYIGEKSPVNKELEVLGIRSPSGVFDANNFQPRFDLTWDIKGKGKDIVKIGGGAFSNELTTHAYTFALRGNGLDYRQVSVNTNSPQAAIDLVGPSWRQSAQNQPTAEQLLAAGVDVKNTPTDIVTIDPNLQAPMTWKTNATYTHYFADWFRASISGYYANTIKQNIFKELNLQEKKDANGSLALSSDHRVQYERKYNNFGSIVQYTNANWSSQYLAATLELGFLYKDGLLNISYTRADLRGEAPYGAGSAWLQGQGIGYSYNDYFNTAGSQNSGYVVNNKIVVMFSSPSYKGFSLSGAFTMGQYERFTVRTENDMNGIANEGGGDGRVQAGDLAYVYDPNNPNTPANVAQDMRTLLANTSPEYRAVLQKSLGTFANQNSGQQPWQYQTSLTLKKEFNIYKTKLIARVDAFNIVNLIDYQLGYNDVITNLNLYKADSSGNIAINKDAGKKIRVFNPEQLGRVQFGLKFEF